MADDLAAMAVALAACATSAAVAADLAEKADKDDVYDRDYIDEKLAGKVNNTDYWRDMANKVNNSDFQAAMALKANSADVYTKTEIDNNFYTKTYIDNNFYDKTYIDTTVNGFATTTALTNGLATKANISDVYNKTTIDNNYYTKTTIDTNFYTKTLIDNNFYTKATINSNYYTKTQVDDLVNGIVPAADHVGQKYNNSLGGEIFNYYEVNTSVSPTIQNIASGDYSHAEGYNTHATGSRGSHAEGVQTIASGNRGSHAEGYLSTASGWAAHAEGSSKAFGDYSHASGYETYADEDYMTCVGKYNIYNADGPNGTNAGKLFVVGNGTINNRRDAFTVYDDARIQINTDYGFYIGYVTIKAEYNNTTHYCVGEGTLTVFGSKAVLSNAKITFDTATSNTYIYILGVYDGATSNGVSGFKNFYGIRTSVGGGFITWTIDNFNSENNCGTKLLVYSNNRYEIRQSFGSGVTPVILFNNNYFYSS